MSFHLKEIPGINHRYETAWKIRALGWERINPTLSILQRWAKEFPHDYRAIISVLRVTGRSRSVPVNQKIVKQGDIYTCIFEARANGRQARLMFFYDDLEETIVCVNGYEKGNGNQTDAFQTAERYRHQYFKSKGRN